MWTAGNDLILQSIGTIRLLMALVSECVCSCETVMTRRSRPPISYDRSVWSNLQFALSTPGVVWAIGEVAHEC